MRIQPVRHFGNDEKSVRFSCKHLGQSFRRCGRSEIPVGHDWIAVCQPDARIVHSREFADQVSDILERLASDPVLLVDVLFAVCKPEADAKGITDEEFGRAMAGDAIELAATALLDEIIDFFPEAKRKVFRKILDASRRFEARSKQALTELLEDPAFDEKIDQALDRLTISSSVSPESPESIPTP